MYSSRVSLFALLLVLSSLVVVPGASNAEPEYFADRNCANSGCHSISAAVPTCNGCHAHGTHPDSMKSSMNLIATTDKASYVVGDDITVTLAGGYKPSGVVSWVRVNVYASNGSLLVSNSTECPHNASSYAASCDLPVTLKTRAGVGMTGLYVAWMGHENDRTGAAKGTTISSMGVGSRPVAQSGHIEEIVLTNQFSVTEAAAPASGGGGGLLDWIFISGLIGMFFARGTIRRS